MRVSLNGNVYSIDGKKSTDSASGYDWWAHQQLSGIHDQMISDMQDYISDTVQDIENRIGRLRQEAEEFPANADACEREIESWESEISSTRNCINRVDDAFDDLCRMVDDEIRRGYEEEADSERTR